MDWKADNESGQAVAVSPEESAVLLKGLELMMGVWFEKNLRPLYKQLAELRKTRLLSLEYICRQVRRSLVTYQYRAARSPLLLQVLCLVSRNRTSQVVMVRSLHEMEDEKSGEGHDHGF